MLTEWFTSNQPRLLSALILLAAGVVLAVVLRALAAKLTRALERLTPGREVRTSFAGLARERSLSQIVGGIVFWAILLFFVALAANALGIPLLTRAVESFALLVPRLLGAALILAVGLVAANVARTAAAAAAAGTTFAPALGQVARLAIVLAACLLAIAELGVDITLITATFSVALAALLGAFAIAFGLGARTAISNIIGSHYLRQRMEVGQSVRVGGAEGTVAALTATAVILHVPEGRLVIPAKQFDEMPSLLLVKGAPR